MEVTVGSAHGRDRKRPGAGRSNRQSMIAERPEFVGATAACETRAERPEHVKHALKQRAGALQAAQSLPAQPESAQKDPSYLDELKIKLMRDERVE